MQPPFQRYGRRVVSRCRTEPVRPSTTVGDRSASQGLTRDTASSDLGRWGLVLGAAAIRYRLVPMSEDGLENR